MILRRDYRFEASHQLPCHGGQCRRIHGHSYRFRVTIDGPVDPATGMVIDFEDLDRLVAERVLPHLDHRHLNELLENPTAEWIAAWIWRTLAPHLPGLAEIEVWEMEGASVAYRGESLPPGGAAGGAR